MYASVTDVSPLVNTLWSSVQLYITRELYTVPLRSVDFVLLRDGGGPQFNTEILKGGHFNQRYYIQLL